MSTLWHSSTGMQPSALEAPRMWFRDRQSMSDVKTSGAISQGAQGLGALGKSSCWSRVSSCIFPISLHCLNVVLAVQTNIKSLSTNFSVLAIAKVFWSKIPRTNEAYDSDWDRFQAHRGVMVQSVANCSDFVVSQVCSPQITTCISRDGKVLGVLSWQKGLGLVQYRNLSWHVVHVKFTFLFCIGLLWRDSEFLWSWCW